MCGICGSWNVEHAALEAGLRGAMENLRHRGPDDEGCHVEGGLALGMRRLAIIDVEGGHQPVWNEARDVAIVMNGEIYNYPDLNEAAARHGHRLASHGDTEAAVHVYEEEGPRFVERLRGMFALAVFDRRSRTLVLARDRFGKKPLYYTEGPEGGLLFASELEALVTLMRSVGREPEIDPQAVYDFLSLGNVPQPATIYRGVRALPPGHVLTARDGEVRIEPYWTPAFGPKLDVPYEEALRLVREKTAEAVRVRLRSDVPLGTYLSAGIDSSIVTFEAARAAGTDLQTFTVATSDPEFDESPVAKRTAERFGVRNTPLHLDVDPARDLPRIVERYGQPFSDPSAIPSLAVSRLAREHVKVVLNGDGGDELFGGYRRHLAAHVADRFAWLPPGAAKRLASLLSPESRSRRSYLGLAGRWLRGLALAPEERYLVWTTDMLRDADKRDAWRGPEPRATEALVREHLDPSLGGMDRQIRADLALNLLSGLLVKMDIATSAHSLEGRSPFMDHELAELAFRLPAAYRVRGRRTKSLLRDAYRDVLPDEVLHAPKRGFEIPLASWLRDEWRPLIHDTLLASDARVLAYVEPDLVRRATDPAALQDRNAAYVTYAMLVLELWLRQAAR